MLTEIIPGGHHQEELHQCDKVTACPNIHAQDTIGLIPGIFAWDQRQGGFLIPSQCLRTKQPLCDQATCSESHGNGTPAISVTNSGCGQKHGEAIVSQASLLSMAIVPLNLQTTHRHIHTRSYTYTYVHTIIYVQVRTYIRSHTLKH